MTHCPVCNRDTADLLCSVSFDETELSLIRHLNKYWIESDGVCRECVDAVRETAQQVRDQFAKARTAKEIARSHDPKLN